MKSTTHSFLVKAALAVLLFPGLLFLSGPAAAGTAAENFRFYCAQCHDLDGRGMGPNATRALPVDPPDLTDLNAIGRLSDAKVVKIITHGTISINRSTLMPAYKMTLSPKEIEELKDFLREICICVP